METAGQGRRDVAGRGDRQLPFATLLFSTTIQMPFFHETPMPRRRSIALMVLMLWLLSFGALNRTWRHTFRTRSTPERYTKSGRESMTKPVFERRCSRPRLRGILRPAPAPEA